MEVRPVVKSVGHVGLFAPDPDALAAFYADVLGMQIVGLGGMNPAGVRSSLFLSSRPDENAFQVALYANPDNRYTAFQVDSLADLQRFYRLVVERELPIRWALSHGDSLAFYFSDPAGNPIKLYWPTGCAYPQPHGHPIDLTQSEAVLRQDVANLVAQFKVAQGGEK